MVLGLGVLLAVLDRVVNDSYRIAVAVCVGAVLGLCLVAVQKARRGPDS